MQITKYNASFGKDVFISYTSKNKKDLYAFCRLYLPKENKNFKNTAFIRELHVYGELVPVGKGKNVQHQGLGRLLLAEAEKLAKKNGYAKMSVISGVGVRGYYRKFGYRLKDTYMLKKIQ